MECRLTDISIPFLIAQPPSFSHRHMIHRPFQFTLPFSSSHLVWKVTNLLPCWKIFFCLELQIYSHRPIWLIPKSEVKFANVGSRNRVLSQGVDQNYCFKTSWFTHACVLNRTNCQFGKRKGKSLLRPLSIMYSAESLTLTTQSNLNLRRITSNSSSSRVWPAHSLPPQNKLKNSTIFRTNICELRWTIAEHSLSHKSLISCPGLVILYRKSYFRL